MSMGCSSCAGGRMNGMGFLEGLGDVLPGSPGFVGPLSPDQQAAYAAGVSAGNITPDQLSNIQSFFYSQGQMSAPNIGDSISSLFSGNGMIWLVVGVAVFAMMSGSGGRRR